MGVGILPLQFAEGQNAESFGLTGKETYNIKDISGKLGILKKLSVESKRDDGTVIKFNVICRLDSAIEIEYYKNGGILHYVLPQFLSK